MTGTPDDRTRSTRPESPASDSQDSSDGDFGVDDLKPRRRSKSAPAEVGPSDVADSVKEVLRAAFDGPGDLQARPIRQGSSAKSGRISTSDDDDLDETGPVTIGEDFADDDGPTNGTRRARRRFRDIAREHDTRIKSQSSADPGLASSSVRGAPDGVKAVESPPAGKVKITEGGKKRVVITDDEVLNIKRAAPREERKRKKTRRRSDEVTRLPNRRWWSRTADGRWRLRWYSVVGVALVALVLVLLLLTSPLLSIRKIVVEGAVYTNQSRLDEVLVQLKGDAILTADLHGATRQIEAIPWVRKARISMHLPSRVVVQIDEREPTAFFRAVDGFIRVTDREGRILDVIEGDPVDYTRIIGSGPNLAPGDFVGQPFLGAVELLGALPVSLADRLVSATVSPEGEISLQLSPNLSIIFGQPTDFQVKLVAVVNEMKRQGSRSYTVIDVSTGEPNVR